MLAILELKNLGYMPRWLQFVFNWLLTAVGVLISSGLFFLGFRNFSLNLAYLIPSSLTGPATIFLIAIYITILILIYWSIWKDWGKGGA